MYLELCARYCQRLKVTLCSRAQYLYISSFVNCFYSVACRAKDEERAVLSRTLACIADIIGVKASNKGGLRSGPAANLSWQEGLELLKVISHYTQPCLICSIRH